MLAARKLKNRRRRERWADKAYKKAHLGTRWKCNPFKGSSHAKGIVVEKIAIEAKQPNSAYRKSVRVQLIKNGKKITAFVPRDGCLNYIDENDEVLVAGFGRSGHSVGDLPGVRFKVVKVAVGLGTAPSYRKFLGDPANRVFTVLQRPAALIMALERFLLKSFRGIPKEKCNEGLQKKIERNEQLRQIQKRKIAKHLDRKRKRLTGLKMRALHHVKEYIKRERELVELRRQAKAEGSFYKEADAKVVFVVRIKGINKLTPKPRLILKLFRLLQLHNGVFIKMNKATMEMLKVITPYVTFGYPTLSTIRKLLYKRGYAKVGRRGAWSRVRISNDDIVEENLGKHGVHGMEDVVHQIYTCGPKFKEVTNFLWPFKLNPPRKGFVAKRHGYTEARGGDAGNREHLINELLCRMI
ncbi:ribosomal protein RPL7 [Babesia caballi]|uniref:Ribosomal protein RPL7 n=1 Tax=Babesia caballi TaxID=5871 RepID=A0AAV4LTQ3_BABCB|nr:ribosomal protein RPL7 [Babesia caballi]